MGGPHGYNPKRREEFRNMAVKVAMEQALSTYVNAQKYNNNLSKRAKAAWLDCQRLVNNTISQLSSTFSGLNTNGSITDFDAQTWLSTALTNLQVCKTGSRELKVSSTLFSDVASSNVTELISNSLSINGGFLDKQETPNDDVVDGEFPSWVSKNKRKMLQDAALASQAIVVVAKDGSGKFTSVQKGINYAVSKRVGSKRVIVYVKRGVYKENVDITSLMGKITLVGDGLRYTIITGSRSVKGGYTTYSSATFGVEAAGFIARGITFRNTAGPKGAQAVALRSSSDLSVFYACGFEGYQDTVFAMAQRQFYKLCYIYGTIDFIFGNAAVVFQNCNIYARKPLSGQSNVITAQGRGDPNQNTGISIHNSRVMAAPEFKTSIGSVGTYLGRPWQQYSRTVFLKTYFDTLVNPGGWLAWGNTNFAQSSCYYGEYKNFGPGSSTTKRVNWTGYHKITDDNVAKRFTVANLIAGAAWLPATGVPFISGL
ncbi:probable pectinesterase/pectinesterase inhibitor 33 [Impatiens glandulifera]|uniref:probable pectinesterase/pectinesterase inhibitor 33 n=1 Tax=Impatiens glandulifera TaxID=253017 RepID=UPI001FB156F2|nr:probable pectinesterase/pectinesterase inhibitor 33 [Impatiens glandulifera]